MNVELEKIAKDLSITDYVVRHYPDTYSDGEDDAPYFQARVLCPNLTSGDAVLASFSYYSKSGEFLGLDSESQWAVPTGLTEPYAVSIRIWPPEGTDSVKCDVALSKQERSFYYYIWRTISISILLLVVSAIFKVLMPG